MLCIHCVFYIWLWPSLPTCCFFALCVCLACRALETSSCASWAAAGSSQICLPARSMEQVRDVCACACGCMCVYLCVCAGACVCLCVCMYTKRACLWYFVIDTHRYTTPQLPAIDQVRAGSFIISNDTQACTHAYTTKHTNTEVTD